MCSTANTQPQLPLIPINIDIGLVHLSYSLRILGSSQNSALSAPTLFNACSIRGKNYRDVSIESLADAKSQIKFHTLCGGRRLL